MGWSVDHNQKENVMILTLEGLISFREIIESSIANIEKAKEQNSNKMLIDCTFLEIDANRTELFELPSKLYNKWGMDPTTRIALIEPKDPPTKAKAQFYIFATQNLGWIANMFKSRKKALMWLLA